MLTAEQIHVIRNIGDLIIDAFLTNEDLTDEDLQLIWSEQMNKLK